MDTRQQVGGGMVSPAMDTSSVARGRRRIGPPVIAAAVACAALAIAALAVSMGGSPGIGAGHPATRTPNADTVRSARLDKTVAWFDGLAAGLILPSDVTSRLATQDPAMAEAVMAAWSDLDRSGDGIVLDKTVAWVDGLAAGLILPSDVTSRLATQDPRMAEAVMAAWSDLNIDRAGDITLRQSGSSGSG
jgi:hypothetical protein